MESFKSSNSSSTLPESFVNFWQLHRRVWDFRIEASISEMCGPAPGVYAYATRVAPRVMIMCTMCGQVALSIVCATNAGYQAYCTCLFQNSFTNPNLRFMRKNNAKFHALNFVIEIIWTHCSFIHNTFLPDGCHSWSPLKSTRTPNMMTNKYFMEKVLSLPSFPHSFTPHHFRLKRDTNASIDGW